MAASTIDVKNNEDEGGKDSSECSEEVRISNKEESFEFVMFIRANCDSFSLLDEVVSCLLVVNFVLIDTFL